MPKPLTPSILATHSKLFVLLDSAGQQKLLEQGEREDVEAGAVIVREREQGSTFYLVLDGKVGVEVAQGGQPKEMAVLESGAFFGEIGALVGEERSATVTAKTRTKLLRFEAAKVQEILKGYPKVREVLVKLALKRSEENLQQLLVDDVLPSVEGPVDPDATTES